jgi:uncharacterized membrane protein
MGFMLILTVFASAMVLLQLPQTVVFLGIFIFEALMLFLSIIVLFKPAEKRFRNIQA